MTKHKTEAGLSPAVSEWDELRARVLRLEAEVAGYRAQEQLLAKTLLAATRFAMTTREEARREAELILRKARSQALKRVESLDQERGQAQHELLRLHRITDRTRAGLSTLLTATLEQLRLEAEYDAPTSEPMSEPITALAGALEAALDGALGKESDPRSGVDRAPPGGAP